MRVCGLRFGSDFDLDFFVSYKPLRLVAHVNISANKIKMKGAGVSLYRIRLSSAV